MVQRRKCKECVNFLPIVGTVYGHCKVRPFAVKQGGWESDKEFVTTRGSWACKDNFVETDKIPPMIKKCKWCGKEFIAVSRGGKEFCCEECRKKWSAERRAKQRAEDKAIKTAAKKKATRKSKQPKVPLSEVMRMAAEEHLSYGQIVQKYGL